MGIYQISWSLLLHILLLLFSLRQLEAEGVSITLSLQKLSRDNESCVCPGAANPGCSDTEEPLSSNRHRNKPQVKESIIRHDTNEHAFFIPKTSAAGSPRKGLDRPDEAPV